MPLPPPHRRRGLARLMGAATLAGLLATASACTHETLRYPHATAENAAQAWADAFNRNEKGQLRLLVHPQRRAAFDEHRADLEGQLKTFDIQKWVMGERVLVEPGSAAGGTKLEGREIVLFFTDSVAVRENKAILVQTDGDWWLWKY